MVTAVRRDAVIEGPPREYALRVPPGWYRIPLDDRLPLRIKQVVESRITVEDPQERAASRSLVTRLLTEETARAKERGGVDLFMHLDRIRDVAVPASCVVTYVDVDARATADVERALASDDAALVVQSLGVAEIAGETAVRRVARRSFDADLVGTDLAGEEAPARLVDFAVPIPGARGMLLFSFGTPDGPVADAMTQLFDAMMEQLRWIR